MREKKKPAWVWLMASSFSMVGSSGEKITREMKLSRKISTRNRSGPICRKKGGRVACPASPLAATELLLCATFKVSSPRSIYDVYIGVVQKPNLRRRFHALVWVGGGVAKQKL